MTVLKKRQGFAANTERRNCRRAVIALSLIAIAAMGRVARAQDAAHPDAGVAWPAHWQNNR